MRPELDRLVADVRAGLVRRLYVYRLDRLSRGGIRATLSIVEELDHWGVELVTIADGFTLAGPARDVIIAVIAWAAQIELEAISERISAARERVEEQGGAWGRPRRLSHAECAVARQMQDAGSTIREISMALKVPKSVIGRELSQKPPQNRYIRDSRKKPKKRVDGARP